MTMHFRDLQTPTGKIGSAASPVYPYSTRQVTSQVPEPCPESSNHLSNHQQQTINGLRQLRNHNND